MLVGVALAAVLQLASLQSRRISPALAEVPVATAGSFQPDGEYPGEPFADARGVRAWGSWSGSDDNAGTITLGPFPAPRMLRFGVSGYPDHEGNVLSVERVDGSQSLAIKAGATGERWEVFDFELPPEWKDRAIRIVGRDAAKGFGGWFAITEPIRGGRSDGNNALLESLAAFAINGLLLGVMYVAAAQRLDQFLRSGGIPIAEDNPDAAGAPPPQESRSVPPHWIPLAAGAIVALGGYVAFWAYFANALLGVIYSCAVIAAATWVLARDRSARGEHPRPDRPPPARPRFLNPEVGAVLRLMLATGAFYLTLLHLFPGGHDFYTLAANRYREAMPTDNVLSHTTAQRLFASEPLKNPVDEWLSSDRPPLQAGWQLLTWPAGKALGVNRLTASGTSALWFQLLWIAAAYGVLRSFRIEQSRAAGWIAALSLCGFFLQNTTYTWPKLSAGAFACGTFALLAFPAADGFKRGRAIWAGIFAGLGWLSHGGVAFSFLALLPLLLQRRLRATWRDRAAAAAALLILVSPWLAYQKLYDPPANRLFKWHLAGQAEKDARGTWETVRASYEKIGWPEAWSNKVSNFHAQVFGDWRELLEFSPANATHRRSHEFFHTGRALTWWPVLAVLAVAVTRRRVFVPPRDIGVLAGWLLLTIVFWCLLMFGRYQAVIHHGSYALMIGLFVFFSVLLERSGRGWLAMVCVLQLVTLGTTWAVGNAAIHGPPSGWVFTSVATGCMLWFVARAFVFQPSPYTSVPAGGLPAATSRPIEGKDATGGDRGPRIGEWWANPRLNFWVVAAFAFLLFLRKPHALHTPQLWAEDGSIFLMQADLHGASALTMPYMGYLHTLPRLVAAIAPRLLDPAWWPAFYNGISFVIWLAVAARLFSARFDLPGKPWLAFALIAVPHTGEVFFNITNLQWLTAFVLIQQVLIMPPKTAAQRASDLVILALITLTGPFGIAFLPLFVWRWWRDRRRDNIAVLGVVFLCAALQAWYVVRTGPRFEFQSEPVNLWTNLVILSRRLIVWPAVGTDAALGWPPAVIAALGGTFMALLIGWALRPHPRRVMRAQIVAAFLLITLAAVYRTRPDTWAADNLDYGDRYFYIPRVLLAWLLIWEFDATPRAVANTARVFCLLVFLMHLREYTVRAPVNYNWAAHVEPIRQGVRADLPTLPEGWMLEYHGRPKKDE